MSERGKLDHSVVTSEEPQIRQTSCRKTIPLTEAHEPWLMWWRRRHTRVPVRHTLLVTHSDGHAGSLLVSFASPSVSFARATVARLLEATPTEIAAH
eukprot:SM000003S11189  [mRNA]  locus=s3:1460994:1462145:+ [translate_table: standard]